MYIEDGSRKDYGLGKPKWNRYSWGWLGDGVPEKSSRKGRDAFIKHFERASEIVSRWPEWKQELLGGTGRSQGKSSRKSNRKWEVLL